MKKIESLRVPIVILTLATMVKVGVPNLVAVDFKNEIKPIFEQHCLDCHGPNKQKSELRLDKRAILLKGGSTGLPSIVPGQPDKSHLVELIKSNDQSERMPPKGEQLSNEQILRIEEWISQGAQWPGQMNEVFRLSTDHWSFQSVRRPQIPKKTKNPIDAFLDVKLKSSNIQPNEMADPLSLIRRASIVLTGLPPTWEKISKFQSDFKNNPESAYQELIDQLLASKHFGERWAQHWLDVIRWAESNGSEANLYRKNAWLYRDYVVRAFNEDLPYDRFIQEQIAGDTLGAGEATGFLVAGPHVPAATVGREPSAIRQARADRMDEIMQTIGASVMGITMNCARCHNHKFDPISLKDYYAMTGIFQDIEFGSRFPEYADDHPLRKTGDSLMQEINLQRDILASKGGWEENWGAYREINFPAVSTSSIRIRFKMRNLNLDELEIYGPENPETNLAELRMDTVLTGYPEDGVDGRNPLERIHDGEYGTMAWRVKIPKESDEMPWVIFKFPKSHTIDRIRLSANREYFYDTDYLTQSPYLPKYEFDIDIQKADGGWQPWTGTWFINKKLPEESPERKSQLKKLQAKIDLFLNEGPRPGFVGRFIPPDTTYILHRGSPENKRDEVYPAGPEILEGELDLNSNSPGPERRAGFANWITKPENPLTSRVMVNRIWHHIFGRGIVSTTSDFGEAGAKPTHPELLDWLAAEFIAPTTTSAKPWSVKGMIRLLVTSEAFKRSSLPQQRGLYKDPDSTLLWRFPPRRMEAEVIRDSILQASGKLDRQIGGKSYRIHNVKKTYAQWEVVNNHGPETWRRMLYQERMRRVDDRMFTAFDFPDCGQVRAKRPISTTPLQALNLMNSDFIVEQSRLIAERTESDSDDSEKMDQRIARCFQLILGRNPSQSELTVAKEISVEHGLHLVCRGLLNSNEFAFLP